MNTATNPNSGVISSMFSDLKKINKPEEKFLLKKEQVSTVAKKSKPNITKRTFEVRDEAWADFALLASADKKTFNDYINELIEKEVKDNAGFLEQLKKRKEKDIGRNV